MQHLYVIFVKLSDKLLKCIMFGQTLTDVKLETLKTQLSCDRREDGSQAHGRREDGSQAHGRREDGSQAHGRR